jgi:hypothetical protein
MSASNMNMPEISSQMDKTGPTEQLLQKKTNADKLQSLGSYLMKVEQVTLSLPLNLIKVLVAMLVLFLFIWFIITASSGFENNDIYDPYGTGIRFFQSRDDTGVNNSNMYQRQFKEPSKISQLVGTAEPPHFSEGYNIDAKIENGSVLFEQENFKKAGLTNEQLTKARLGL